MQKTQSAPRMRNICIVALPFMTLLIAAGCDVFSSSSEEEPAPTFSDQQWVVPGDEAADVQAAPPNTQQRIVSDGAITVDNGKVTFGTPQVTEAVEREIYASLKHRRKMAEGIKNNSGSERGIQQMNDESELLYKMFMMRHKLTREQVDAIVAKGDAAGW